MSQSRYQYPDLNGTVIQQILYNRCFYVTCASTFNFFRAFRTYSWKFAHLFEVFPTIQSFLQYPWISSRIFCKRARQYKVTSKPCNKISSHLTKGRGRVQQLKIGEVRLISIHGQRISIWYVRTTVQFIMNTEIRFLLWFMCDVLALWREISNKLGLKSNAKCRPTEVNK